MRKVSGRWANAGSAAKAESAPARFEERAAHHAAPRASAGRLAPRQERDREQDRAQQHQHADGDEGGAKAAQLQQHRGDHRPIALPGARPCDTRHDRALPSAAISSLQISATIAAAGDRQRLAPPSSSTTTSGASRPRAAT